MPLLGIAIVALSSVFFDAMPSAVAGVADEGAIQAPLAATGSSMDAQFDIAAGALPSALDVFSAASGLQILYDGNLARGRQSAAVHGRMTSDAALALLLAGTGLTATFTRDRNVIILLSPNLSMVNYAPAPVGPTTVLGAIHVDVPKPVTGDGMYATLVQFELQRALRRTPRPVSGNYEAMVRIWVNEKGIVRKSQLVSSNGDNSRDLGLLKLVQNISVGTPPPADFRQPVSVHVTLSQR